MTATLTREQQAVQEFLSASEFMRHIAADRQDTGLLDLSDAVVQAIAAFGAAELYARQAERVRVLGAQASRGQAASRLSTRFNDKGLRCLAQARQALGTFRQDVGKYPQDTNVREHVSTFEQELREALVDLEVKASDVEKIQGAIARGLDAVRGGGIAALPGYLQEHLAELERLRRRQDRGATENIPVWKIAAIAIAVGVWIWAFFKCGIFRNCTFAEGLTYAVIFWLAVLVTRFC
jgi:hypothetical protein